MDIKYIYCNLCKHLTKHQLKSSQKSEEVELDVDENNNIFPIGYLFYTHNFWICMGCELATLEVQYRDLDDDDEEPIDTEFFPTRAIKIRDPRNFSSIPKEIN